MVFMGSIYLAGDNVWAVVEVGEKPDTAKPIPMATTTFDLGATGTTANYLSEKIFPISLNGLGQSDAIDLLIRCFW